MQFVKVWVHKSATIAFCWNNSYYNLVYWAVIMSIPTFPAGFTISDTKLEGPTTIAFLILLIDSLTMVLPNKAHFWVYLPETNYSYPIQSLSSKASDNNFFQLFSYLHQCSIIISYTHQCYFLCFDYLLCNLNNHVSFLIIPLSLCNFSKSFPF